MSSLRKILFPFSLLYGGVMLLRNRLYDKGILKSSEFDLPVIAVGNLSFGGTGKSPMVEYLVNLLKEDKKLGVLSRGYRRRTKGFMLVSGRESAAQVGDEPLQIKNKFPEAFVAVDESRTHGIKEMLKYNPSPEIIILDDAFQHRKISAGLYILLTAHADLYYKDMVLPAGNLREPISGANRADIIVVTKCPEDLDLQGQGEVIRKLKPVKGQKVFFSRIGYSETIHSRNKSLELKNLKNINFTLVTGIANFRPLVEYLEKMNLVFEHKAFKDHHNFTEAEITDLQHEEFILTTEKDYTRLKDEISREKIFYLPIRTEFIDGQEEFNNLIKSYVQKK